MIRCLPCQYNFWRLSLSRERLWLIVSQCCSDGLAIRKGATSCIKSITNFPLLGTRKKVGPRKIWSECVKTVIDKCGLAGVNPLDRDSWRAVVRHSLVLPTPLNGTRIATWFKMDMDGWMDGCRINATYMWLTWELCGDISPTLTTDTWSPLETTLCQNQHAQSMTIMVFRRHNDLRLPLNEKWLFTYNDLLFYFSPEGTVYAYLVYRHLTAPLQNSKATINLYRNVYKQVLKREMDETYTFYSYMILCIY